MVGRLLALGAVALLLLAVAATVYSSEGVDCAGDSCSTAGEVAGLALIPLAAIALGALVAALVAQWRSGRR